MAWEYPPSFSTEEGSGGGWCDRGGARGGLQGLLSGQILQRLAKQIIETSIGVHVEEIIKIFSQDRITSVFVEHNFETFILAWVWWFRSTPCMRLLNEFHTSSTCSRSYHSNMDIISTSVRAAVAAALHHSRDAGPEMHDAPRRKKATARAEFFVVKNSDGSVLQMAAMLVDAGVFPLLFEGSQPVPQLPEQIVDVAMETLLCSNR